MKIFGVWDDLPVQMARKVVAVPVGERCKACSLPIADNEAGDYDPADDKPIHRECLVLGMGHDADHCACKHYPSAATPRDCALELFRQLKRGGSFFASGGKSK